MTLRTCSTKINDQTVMRSGPVTSSCSHRKCHSVNTGTTWSNKAITSYCMQINSYLYTLVQNLKKIFYLISDNKTIIFSVAKKGIYSPRWTELSSARRGFQTLSWYRPYSSPILRQWPWLNHRHLFRRPQ